MKEINRMCNIAKVIFNDNLITFALENDISSKYYMTNITLKEKNIDQLRRFITDCDELITKPVTFKIYTDEKRKEEYSGKILIDNN